MQRRLLSFGVVCGLALSATTGAWAQAFKDADKVGIEKKFHYYLFETREKLKQRNELNFSPEQLKAFYQKRGYKPCWIEESGFFDSGVYDLISEKPLKALPEAWTQGINDRSYHLDDLNRLLEQEDDLTEPDWFELELLLSSAMVMYAHDVSGMRISPEGLKLNEDSMWRMQLSVDDLVEMAPEEGSCWSIYGSFEPDGRLYKALRKAVKAYGRDAVVKAVASDSKPLRTDKVIKPGEQSPLVPGLWIALGGQGAYGQTYGPELVDLVKAFQRTKNIVDDGLIGAETLFYLNDTPERRIAQLLVNLERLRWVPQDNLKRSIIANIPSTTLWAIEDGDVKLEMPIIVGSPHRPTYSLLSEVRGVRFNPDWTIPSTIKFFDIVRHARKDPDFFTRKEIQVFDGMGSDAQSLDPNSIDWNSVTKEDVRDMRMVKAPGDDNPLGRVRVLMPNKYNIYLHDTDKPELFDSGSLAQSSGCIRVKDPIALANFIMEGKSGWRRSQTESVLGSKQKQDVKIDMPFPVYVTYYSIWQDGNDDLVYGFDLYKIDHKLLEKLKKIDGLPGS